MRYALIVLACAAIVLFAGCGNSTPDNMVASVYSIDAFRLYSVSNPIVAGAKPVISWHVTNASLVQKIYQHLSALPLDSGGENNHCDAYGEVLTFQSGATILAQLYSDPCPAGGIYITTLSGGRDTDRELLLDLDWNHMPVLCQVPLPHRKEVSPEWLSGSVEARYVAPGKPSNLSKKL